MSNKPSRTATEIGVKLTTEADMHHGSSCVAIQQESCN